MVSQQERIINTRARIINAAHTLFLQEGYANTTMQMILVKAKVSKGGMYHHFESKVDIFAEIFSTVSSDSIKQANTPRSKRSTQMEMLYDAAISWLKVVREPEVASILLEQGPSVLGWKRARSIEEKYSLATIVQAFQEAHNKHEISIQSASTIARLFNALLTESAFIMMEADNDSWAQIERSIQSFLDGLISDNLIREK